MITADFNGIPSGKPYICSQSLWQYDTGQQLQIKGLSGIDETTEVHFGLKLYSRAIVKTGEYDSGASTLTVDIPNKFLEYADGVPARVWVHLRESETSAYTIREIQIPVLEREKPDDYISGDDKAARDIIIEVIDEYFDKDKFEVKSNKAASISDEAAQDDGQKYPSVAAARGYTDAAISNTAAELMAMIKDKSQRYYSPLDYGAVGDGVTVDTVAFQNCINEANGAPVIIPSGTYVVDYCAFTSAVGKPIILIGKGNPVITRTTAPTGNNNAPLFKFWETPFAYITGITFDANRDSFLKDATTTKGLDGNTITETTYQEWLDTACIYFYRGGKNIHIENCTFCNCSREGVMLHGGTYQNILINNNRFVNTSACLWLTNGSGESRKNSSFENIRFENNYVKDCRTMAVEFDNVENIVEDENIPNRVKDVVIRGNKFLDIIKCAIRLAECENVLIENNEFTSRAQLFEHGRKSSDTFEKTFVWILSLEVTSERICGENIRVKNNIVSTVTAVKFRINEAYNSTHFKNVEFSGNEFNCIGNWGAAVSARKVENITLKNNTATTDSQKSRFFLGTGCTNVKIKNNDVQGYETLYTEEPIKQGTTVVIPAAGANISLIGNIAELTNTPYILSADNFSDNSVAAMTIVDNKCNGWNNAAGYYDKVRHLKHVSGNVDISQTPMCELNGAVNDKYNLSLDSIHNIFSIDTTGLTAQDDYVIVRTLKSFANPERTIIVLVNGAYGIKTDTTASTSGFAIENVVEIPTGGILKLFYNGNKWQAFSASAI